MFINDDLTIPDFLRATGPGAPCAPPVKLAEEQAEDWPFAVRRDNCTAADIAVMYELAGKQQEKEAVAQYKEEAFFAERQQWAIENPELAAMDRKAKRDARRRIASMGVKPARRGRC